MLDLSGSDKDPSFPFLEVTMTTPKLTLYVDDSLRTRVKTAAAHAGCSMTEFLLPFIENALAQEEERMRGKLLQLKCPASPLPEVG
jgi:uncharacterized protein (DUF1778 family)